MKDTNTINNCIHPKIRLRFDTQEKFFGPGVCELLELIDETGSVQKACARMELSYSKGSKMLKKLDQVSRIISGIPTSCCWFSVRLPPFMAVCWCIRWRRPPVPARPGI